MSVIRLARMIVTDVSRRDGHDRGVVVLARRLDRVLPDARPREQRLHEDRAHDQRREAQPEDRHHRQQRVAQDVADRTDAFAQSLGPRRRHVVLAHDLEHARPRVAQERGGPGERQHQRRQDQVPELVDDGRQRADRVPDPPAGKSLMPKSWNGQRPRRRRSRGSPAGTAAARCRRSRPRSSPLSSFECWRNAETTPSSTPRTTLMASAVPISLMVFGIRFARALAMDDRRRSPRRGCPGRSGPATRHSARGTGWLSPSASLSFSMSCGLMSLPGRTSAETGSPGARFANVNVTIDTPSRIGTAIRSRRTMKRQHGSSGYDRDRSRSRSSC